MKKEWLVLVLVAVLFFATGLGSAAPTISSLILNSTTINNTVSDNLTAYATTSDKVIYNWFVNNSPMTIFNMPFDGGTLGSNSTCTSCLVRDYALGNNGTLVNSPLYNSTGGFDRKGAYQFSFASNQYIQINAGANVNAGKYYTISAWVYPLPMTGWAGIVEDESTTAGLFMWANQFGMTGASNCFTDPKTFGRWYHVVAVANGTQQKIYLNGTLDKTCGNVPFSLTALNRIGRSTSSPYYFNGTIDEITVWNRSLSAQEISALYNNQTNIMVSQELTNGSVWRAEAYPNNNTADGAKVISNNITIGVASTITASLLINFTSPTPETGASQYATNVPINTSIITDNLGSLIYNWNGTNFTMYNDSLVLMMNFDNLSSLGEDSTKVIDVSKYGNNGTINGATWNSSGKYGGALYFAGTNNNINLSGTFLNNISAFTYSAWINSPVIGNSWAGIISQYNNDGSCINMQLHGDGRIYTDVDNSGLLSSSPYGMTAAATILPGNWYHVVLAYNGTGVTNADKMKIYVNGVEKTLSFPNGAIANTTPTLTNPITIGSLNAVASAYYTGTIDEPRIWVNRTLSTGEVYQQYVSNLQKFNSTQWYFYVNQSKNSTAGLDPGNYTYEAFATDNSGNANQTEQRTIIISADTTYPLFSNYSDNNVTLSGSGTALFNITLANTNGTVLLSINNNNYTATNLSVNVYNVSLILDAGTYNYTWLSWGNGSNHNYNTSNTLVYVVNASPETTEETSTSSTYYSKTYYSNEYLPSTGNKFNMFRNDKIKFIVHSVNHTLTLGNFNSSTARVVIQSNPITAYLQKGTLYEFDLNNDFVNDVKARYNGMNKTKAMIFIQEIIQPKKEGSVENTVVSNEVSSNVEAEDLGYSDWKVYFFAIAIILLILFVVWKKFENKIKEYFWVKGIERSRLKNKSHQYYP